MEGAFFLLAVLSVGHYYTTHCYKIKYVVARKAGHALYLSVVFCGSVFVFLAILTYQIQELCWPKITGTPHLFYLSRESEIFIIALIASFYVLTCTSLLNLPKNAKAKALVKAWKLNDLEKMCSEAAGDFKPISVTLDNNKVYVGWIYDSLEPDKEGHLTLIPIYSGYRNKDNLELVLTQKYEGVLKTMTELSSEPERKRQEGFKAIQDYRITIAREHIITINIFNDHLYKSFSSASG